MKTGKNFKIMGVRGSLIGDCLMSVPVLYALERRWPGSYKYWTVARKCAQSAPIYFNHPLIDQIVISDADEGFGPRDLEIASTCDVVINPMPEHPEGNIWPNLRNIYEETFIMAGLPLSEYHALPEHERRPRLSKWFKTEYKGPKSVALWPCAGYGKENTRNPSAMWYNQLVRMLAANGFKVYQYGHPLDYILENVIDCHAQSFFDQIKSSVGCAIAVSTDSGSGLILGAYEMNQVTLLTNHWPGHTTNLEAFAPLNPNGKTFVGVDDPDKIWQESVLVAIDNMVD